MFDELSHDRISLISLMQERGFDSEAVSNLVVGLTFLQLWYSSIPKEMQLGHLSKCATPMQLGSLVV